MNFTVVMLAVAILSTLLIIGDATKKSKVCAMKNWPECALEPPVIPTSNFSLTATHISRPNSEGIITVSLKVFRTQCPTLDMENLTWYRLEAFVGGITNTSVGRFIEPLHSRRLETYSCQNETKIVFKTCEPHPLDLPRHYNWTSEGLNITLGDTVHFRLTVQDPDPTICKFADIDVTLVIPASNSSSNGKSKNSSYNGTTKNSSYYETGSGAVGESANNTERCYRQWNCDTARQLVFCGSDGHTYTSRCHKRLTECLTDTIIDFAYRGACITQQTTYCYNSRNDLMSFNNMFPSLWLPTCDCDGLFKPKQCTLVNDNLECWCSYSNSMSQIQGTRRRISQVCTDPSKFEFSCS